MFYIQGKMICKFLAHLRKLMHLKKIIKQKAEKFLCKTAQKYSYKGMTFGNTRPVFKIFYFGCKSFIVIWELMWHNKWENVKNKKNPD